MSQPPTAQGFTKTPAVPLYWKSYGDPHSERLLILHGGPGAHHDYLLPQMLKLAERRHLIFYDQRGGGQSRDDSREAITWETHVADLAAVIAEFELGAATIVGYSWGGLLAMLYATKTGQQVGGGSTSSVIPAKAGTHVAEKWVPASAGMTTPDRGMKPTTQPARLVLIDPAPAASSFRQAMTDEFTTRQRSDRIEKEREELRLSGLRDSDPEAYRQRLFELSVAGYFFDPERAHELTPFRVVGRIQESVWKSLGDYDLLPALRTLSIPTLVVHGRDDPIPVQSSLSVADALKARLLLLEKCGHVPYVEQPRALFSAIEDFLDTYHAQEPE